ncbi:hypothetical protein DCAR_0622819 [Daucus carota subsp. sativus]|uniref:Cytochrome P450 n=1 Tax=Daucus carota subsp. sativus TaxID=79200 RepID=A0AAF0XAE4_DAUCS|nr:PREDICTED: cytochrome P450 76AD1-like [Daucus carota subsp. sativus]WOH03422.1 hypothetical protein DCAR_0622819 [Daucus carota subsp. sativus]
MASDKRALNIYLTNPKMIDKLEGLWLEVVKQMVCHIKESSRRGQVVDIGKLAVATALNQMSNTCFSADVADCHPDRDDNGFHKAVKTIMKVDGKINFADYFPWLKIFDPQGIRRDAKAAYGRLDQLCEKFITQRLKHRVSNFAANGDLLDFFLDFRQENLACFDIIHIKVLLMCHYSLVAKFDWKLPNNMLPEELDMDDTSGITLQKATPLLLIPTPTSN